MTTKVKRRKDSDVATTKTKFIVTDTPEMVGERISTEYRIVITMT